MPGLRLQVKNYRSEKHWRWILSDSRDTFLEDYQVNLRTEDEAKLELSFNLSTHIRGYPVPDRRDENERYLLNEIGEWMGRTLLGERLGNAILENMAQPTCVRVVLPSRADRLLFLPLDIAHVHGQPLAVQGVRFVFQMEEDRPPSALAVTDRLRILALFSLPAQGSPLNLRRERQMLINLVRRLVGTRGLAVELRILQYGVTRDGLRDALEDGDGWDIVHFSGHGMPGSLVLEALDGKADLVSSVEVAQLLRLTGQRLKLVVLSACLSAADTIRQTLTNIGAGAPKPLFGPGPVSSGHAVAEPTAAAPAVARTLSSTLDCAVLAMRYPVEDEFATALGAAVYEGLFLKRQTLPHALQLALVNILGPGGAASAGALSLATPALFGARAADLKLLPPVGDLPPSGSSMAYFPDPPLHFVGRVGAMTTASSTLAPESSSSGVLFYGMAGAGKTSCALELAYHHSAAQRFRAFLWYQVPKEGSDISLALRDFALALETQLPNVAMVHVIDTPEKLRAWLPRLTEQLRNYAALLVLDNIETLLTANGDWRDERWGLVMEALMKPNSLSRLVLTSRLRPSALGNVQAIPVHALPLDEAVLLMRELPNIRRLMDGPPEDGALALRTLRLVQGHPKLIHLAEALASDLARLSKQLDRAEAAAGCGELDAFFDNGEAVFDVEEFASALRDWTISIADMLSGAAKFCFEFLCAIEEEDRVEPILKGNWADVWHACNRPDPVPDLDKTLELLARAGLIDMTFFGDSEEAPFTVAIHPGVAEAGRSTLSQEFLKVVDQELAATWTQLASQGRADYGKVPGAGRLIVRAGLAAFPYLRRLGNWSKANPLLELVITFDSSPAVAAAVVPRARLVAEAAKGTENEVLVRSTLGKILAAAGHESEADEILKATLRQAVRKKNYRLASAIGGTTINMWRRTGRLDEALKLAKRMKKYTKLAGLGIWTQLADEGITLQIQNELGQHDRVLKRILKLKEEEEMKTLAPDLGKPESVIAWNVREGIYDTGREAALLRGEWELALEFSASVLESLERRGATTLETAAARFNDYGPLLNLGRHDEARAVVLSCRGAFEAANDVGALGKALGALASIEQAAGRATEARALQGAALRLLYKDGEPRSIAISHAHLALYIRASAGDWRDVIAHDLAAAFLDILSQRGIVPTRIAALVRSLCLSSLPESSLWPATYADLCETVERVEGVRFSELISSLSRGRVDKDELLQSLLMLSRELRDNAADLTALEDQEPQS